MKQNQREDSAVSLRRSATASLIKWALRPVLKL